MSALRSPRVAIAALALVSLVIVLGYSIAPRSGMSDEPMLGVQDTPPAPPPTIDPADEAARLAAVQRYLRASQFVQTLMVSVQQMFKALPAELAASAATAAEPLKSVDVAAVEAAVAPLVASRLTLRQAQEVAAFYDSDAGRFLVRHAKQGAAAPDPYAAAPHEAAIEKFFSSETGRTLLSVNGDPEIARAVMRAAMVKPGIAP